MNTCLFSNKYFRLDILTYKNKSLALFFIFHITCKETKHSYCKFFLLLVLLSVIKKKLIDAIL